MVKDCAWYRDWASEVEAKKREMSDLFHPPQNEEEKEDQPAPSYSSVWGKLMRALDGAVERCDHQRALTLQLLVESAINIQTFDIRARNLTLEAPTGEE